MENSYPPLRLSPETRATEKPRLHQVDLFPQWYEYYIVNPTDEEVPLPPQRTPKFIKAWWNRNGGDDV